MTVRLAQVACHICVCEEMVGRLAPEPTTSAYVGKVVFALKDICLMGTMGAYALLGKFSAFGVHLDVR